MKTQIIVDMNLIILGDIGVNMDCSKFKEQFVFCEVNDQEKWVEKEPFNGKEQPEDWNEIDEFIEIAKLKSNPPNSYSVWDEGTETWIEDLELKEEQRTQQIEAKCNQVIEAVYPIYKQINITNLLAPYTEEDREVMKAFIDSKRAICHQAIDDGTDAEDVDYSNEP